MALSSLAMGMPMFEDEDDCWMHDGVRDKSVLIPDTIQSKSMINGKKSNTLLYRWTKLLGILVLLLPQLVFAALPTGSYLRYSRPEHCGGINFGDGAGLPDGKKGETGGC